MDVSEANGSSRLKSTTIEVSEDIKQKVLEFVRENGLITNRQCRVLLGIGYEQAITLFNNLVGSGELIREGKTSAIKYRISIKQRINEPQPDGFERRPQNRGRRIKQS